MISVSAALEHLFALVAPLPEELVPLRDAAGRVLSRAVAAPHDQPPFAASAMDGYALLGDRARAGATFRVIGESAAGRPFTGSVGAGEAVRILTGAIVPDGADRVVIQEDTAREGEMIRLTDRLEEGTNIRPAGGDFRAGQTLDAPRRLRPADLALLAAMNHAVVPVHRRPVVALIATGDELVMPGEPLAPGQIVASNSFGLAALFRQAGAAVRLLPLARDTEASLTTVLDLAEGADLVVTIGGASVGDHDLVGPVTRSLGMTPAFWQVAMRPGKPLMAGRLHGAAFVGLPGNPVSAMVCGTIFILPMLAAMQGLPAVAETRQTARLAVALPANGPREHYMRARLTADGIAPFDRQDSALLTILSQADALLIRPPNAPAAEAGAKVDYLAL